MEFRQKNEDSALILRVPLSIFDVLRFPWEAPKFLADFILFLRHFLEGRSGDFGGIYGCLLETLIIKA